MDTYLEGRPFGLFAVGTMFYLIFAYIICKSYRRHLAFNQLAKAIGQQPGFIQDCIMEIRRLKRLNEAAMDTFHELYNPENPLEEMLFQTKLSSLFWELDSTKLNVITDRVLDVALTLNHKTQMILFNSLSRWNTPMQQYYISKLIGGCPDGAHLVISIQPHPNWLKRLYFRSRQIFIDQWTFSTYPIYGPGAPHNRQPIPS